MTDEPPTASELALGLILGTTTLAALCLVGWLVDLRQQGQHRRESNVVPLGRKRRSING